MLIELDERQANILMTIMNFVTANGKQVPLTTITETLNAMAGMTKVKDAPISMDALNAFGAIFGELQINNVNVPIRDIIAISNALQTDVTNDYEKVPDLVKKLQETATEEEQPTGK